MKGEFSMEELWQLMSLKKSMIDELKGPLFKWYEEHGIIKAVKIFEAKAVAAETYVDLLDAQLEFCSKIGEIGESFTKDRKDDDEEELFDICIEAARLVELKNVAILSGPYTIRHALKFGKEEKEKKYRCEVLSKKDGRINKTVFALFSEKGNDAEQIRSIERFGAEGDELLKIAKEAIEEYREDPLNAYITIAEKYKEF